MILKQLRDLGSEERKPLINISQISEMLSLSVFSARAWVKRNDIHPVARDGKRDYFNISDVQQNTGPKVDSPSETVQQETIETLLVSAIELDRRQRITISELRSALNSKLAQITSLQEAQNAERDVPLWSISQVASYLGCSPATVLTYMVRGKVKPFKEGKPTLYKVEDVVKTRLEMIFNEERRRYDSIIETLNQRLADYDAKQARLYEKDKADPDALTITLRSALAQRDARIVELEQMVQAAGALDKPGQSAEKKVVKGMDLAQVAEYLGKKQASAYQFLANRNISPIGKIGLKNIYDPAVIKQLKDGTYQATVAEQQTSSDVSDLKRVNVDAHKIIEDLRRELSNLQAEYDRVYEKLQKRGNAYTIDPAQPSTPVNYSPDTLKTLRDIRWAASKFTEAETAPALLNRLISLYVVRERHEPNTPGAVLWSSASMTGNKLTTFQESISAYIRIGKVERLPDSLKQFLGYLSRLDLPE